MSSSVASPPTEGLKFLKQIDCKLLKDLELHLIVENYATQKHPDVQAWLAKHTCFHIYFTPTKES